MRLGQLSVFYFLNHFSSNFITFITRACFHLSSTSSKMVSSKGEPDNPDLREKIKEEVKNLDKGQSFSGHSTI